MRKERSHSHHRHGFRNRFSRWVDRLRASKRERRKLRNLLVVIAAVLCAFYLGYYYLAPSLSSTGG